MDVVYLYHDVNETRFPLYGYDPDLFRLLVNKGGGFWNKPNCEIVFKRHVDAERLGVFLSGTPLVQVEESSLDQPLVRGFFERPWGSEEKNAAAFSEYSMAETQSLESAFTVSPFAFPHAVSLPEKLSDHWLNLLELELGARKYSPQTRRAYVYYNRLICRTLQKTPEEIRSNDVTEFIALMEKTKDYSASAMNLAISAIKFFFRNILKNDSISEQHRPKNDKRLPSILSKDEIVKVLSMEKNPKHRLLLMLVYSSGLRVSEVVALKKEHIDLSRRILYVVQGKGRKDRMTLLSDKAAQFLEEYYDFFGIEKLLFPGQPPSRPLSIRSAQHIFEKAVRRAGITKKITIHGLRHTFATHLLESGTDIRYIQSLLGHANIRTTERYTHVAKRSILKIKSPLDSI
ncbi:MAG: tyrosine-type recombinase/integrase [Treponema sp.]|jgi:site-specific recombinase XerD|nr:tyrosine-type recombinase/integrase [Treponema sp.]